MIRGLLKTPYFFNKGSKNPFKGFANFDLYFFTLVFDTPNERAVVCQGFPRRKVGLLMKLQPGPCPVVGPRFQFLGPFEGSRSLRSEVPVW